MIPLTSFYALTTDRRRAMIILFIAAPFVILDLINLFLANRYVMIAAYSFGTILYLYIVVLLEAISKIGFWFKIAAELSFKPEAYCVVCRRFEAWHQQRYWAKRHF